MICYCRRNAWNAVTHTHTCLPLNGTDPLCKCPGYFIENDGLPSPPRTIAGNHMRVLLKSNAEYVRLYFELVLYPVRQMWVMVLIFPLKSAIRTQCERRTCNVTAQRLGSWYYDIQRGRPHSGNRLGWGTGDDHGGFWGVFGWVGWAMITFRTLKTQQHLRQITFTPTNFNTFDWKSPGLQNVFVLPWLFRRLWKSGSGGHKSCVVMSSQRPSRFHREQRWFLKRILKNNQTVDITSHALSMLSWVPARTTWFWGICKKEETMFKGRNHVQNFAFSCTSFEKKLGEKHKSTLN